MYSSNAVHSTHHAVIHLMCVIIPRPLAGLDTYSYIAWMLELGQDFLINHSLSQTTHSMSSKLRNKPPQARQRTYQSNVARVQVESLPFAAFEPFNGWVPYSYIPTYFVHCWLSPETGRAQYIYTISTREAIARNTNRASICFTECLRGCLSKRDRSRSRISHIALDWVYCKCWT